MRFVPVAFIAAAAVLLWTAAIAGMCDHLPADQMCVVAVAAATSTIAGMLWLLALNGRDDKRRMAGEYERREEALIRTLSSLNGAPTGPHRWLNSV